MWKSSEPDYGLTPEELREVSDREKRWDIWADADAWNDPRELDELDAWGDE